MRDRWQWKSLCAAVGFALLLAVACAPAEEEPVEEVVDVEETEGMEEEEEIEELVARAELTARQGLNVSGTVTFTQEGNQVMIDARVEGVERAGLHGFHIHETGDCSAPDFTSAGGHFNPAGTPHACPPEPQRHGGDLANIEITDGSGTLALTTDLITLGAGANSVIGKAVILHGGEDDCQTQPTGDAGDRLACGVIALAGEEDEDEPAGVQADAPDA